MKALNFFVFAAAALAASCSPFKPDLGDAPYKCAPAGEGPRCPEGYECIEGNAADPTTHNCVSKDGVSPDGAPVGFQCIDDSGFGENDTKEGAFQTPVASTNAMMSIASAICPEGDKDHYKVDVVAANSNLELVASWESGMPVNASILNAGGGSIGNAAPVTCTDVCPGGLTCTGGMCVTDMGDEAIRICVPNLPLGVYFASAFAGATTKNNYRLTIKIVPNC